MSETAEVPIQTEETPPPVEEAAVDPAAETPVERDVESDTLEIPDSSIDGGKAKYVPLSALTGARNELKEAKKQLEQATDGSARAQQLEARIAQMEGELRHTSAKAQAYDAAVLAQQQTRPQAQPEDDTEAVELAQALDLYTPEGKPDVAKARKIAGFVDRRAQQTVAPLAQHTVQQQANVMLARAKQTIKDYGIDMPEQMIDGLWQRLSPDQAASAEGAKWLLAAAVGAHQLATLHANKGKTPPAGQVRNAQGQFVPQAAADVPPPIYSEKAGGKDLASTMPLSAAEKAYIKAEGITEAEYLKSQPAWMRR